MKNTSERIRIIFLVILFIVGVSISYVILKPEQKLKIYAPSDLNPALVDALSQSKTKKHKVADFHLISQSGDTVTQNDFNNKIYVADFFFTTCGSICPKMTNQLERVQEAYKTNENVMIVSHTVMPEIDSVFVLKTYADAHQANPEKWKFVTGNKKEIYELARKSYFAVTDQGKGDDHDFIHTENFILVDKKKQLRGFYDGTSPEDVDRLIEEISILLKE